ncbi:MAG: CDP-alcohol phosphatidyltransferase family protein [Pseudomonadota bacterium]
MKPRYIPNLLTVFRIALIPPIVWTILHGPTQTAAVLVAVAVLTDGLDGFLAKNFDWRTRFGEITDPIADKALFISVFIALAYAGFIPVWLVWAVLIRDLVIVSGGLAYHYLIGRFEMSPTVISKLNTLVQFLFVFTVLISLSTGFPNSTVVKYLTYIVLATTILSGLDYVVTWGKKAVIQRSQ